MAAISETSDGLRIGVAFLGRRGAGHGSPAQETVDGDTVSVDPDGDLSIRFLGVDAPESRLPLPDDPDRFVSLSDPAWRDHLQEAPSQVVPPLSEPLRVDLERRIDSGDAAANQARHAAAARQALIALIESDQDALGQDNDEFRFFLAFATEVMDGFGRLLAFVNRYQLDRRDRPSSYNERLLATGRVLPYFIWPNIDPFREQPTLLDAVPPPGDGRTWAESSATLQTARESVRAARDAAVGVFDAADPLILEPFEVRYLGRVEAPARWVLDLSAETDELVPPDEYLDVGPSEDRLFVPPAFVPLWIEQGWRRADAS